MKIKMTREEKEKLINSKLLKNREELCFLLGVSYASVMRLEREGIPHLMIGKRPYFFLDEVLSWMRDRTIPAKQRRIVTKRQKKGGQKA